jgi:hypothetical protein
MIRLPIIRISDPIKAGEEYALALTIRTVIAGASALSFIVVDVTAELRIHAPTVFVPFGVVLIIFLGTAADTLRPRTHDSNFIAVALSCAFRVRLVVVRSADRGARRTAPRRPAEYNPERVTDVGIAVLVDGKRLVLRHPDRISRARDGHSRANAHEHLSTVRVCLHDEAAHDTAAKQRSKHYSAQIARV